MIGKWRVYTHTRYEGIIYIYNEYMIHAIVTRELKKKLTFDFCRLCVVIRGFSSPPQRPLTSDVEGFYIPDCIHYIYFPILILEKESVVPFLMFSAKQESCWYHFYNAFGMTRSLTGDWIRDLPHSKPALYH